MTENETKGAHPLLLHSGYSVEWTACVYVPTEMDPVLGMELWLAD